MSRMGEAFCRTLKVSGKTIAVKDSLLIVLQFAQR